MRKERPKHMVPAAISRQRLGGPYSFVKPQGRTCLVAAWTSGSTLTPGTLSPSRPTFPRYAR